jgi:hypothetical protein
MSSQVMKVDFSVQSGNKEAIDALKNIHFTENEKSNNEQVEIEGNDDCYFQH